MQAQTPSPLLDQKELYNPYLECCAESEAVGDLKPISRPLTLANYYAQHLRPGSSTNNMKLLEKARNTLHFYTVSLVSDENFFHVGLNRMRLVYLFGKFCEPYWFKKEAEAYKVLDAPNRSPHIIKLFEAVEVNSPGEGFIITYRHKPYSAEKLIPHVKEVMRQLLQAILCCHANGLIHGDIKPQNIVWEWNEELKPHIYLTDFGATERVEDLTPNTIDGTLYTEVYGAPERMRMILSEEPTKKDLWSAGVTFAEMLLGYDSNEKTLFEWGDLEELEVFQKQRDSLFKDIDPVARDLLDKLLSVDVKQRPSADEALMHPYFTQPKDEPSPEMPHNEELNLSGEEASHTATARKRKRSTKGSTKNSKRQRRDS